MSTPQYVSGLVPLPGPRSDLFQGSVDGSRFWDASAQNAVAAATQELLDHTSGHVNVRSYLPAGYVTDGSVDYSTQVQAALNASAGKTLVAAGTFRISTVSVPSNVVCDFTAATLTACTNWGVWRNDSTSAWIRSVTCLLSAVASSFAARSPF